MIRRSPLGARTRIVRAHGLTTAELCYTVSIVESSGGLVARGQGAMGNRDELLRQLAELRSEHRDLDGLITLVGGETAADQLLLQRLKKRKLLLRDEIAQLESELLPDIIA